MAHATALSDPTVVLVASIAAGIYAATRLGHSELLPWPGGPRWPVVAGITLMPRLRMAIRGWAILSLGRISGCLKPVIAAINGPAVGIGASMPCPWMSA